MRKSFVIIFLFTALFMQGCSFPSLPTVAPASTPSQIEEEEVEAPVPISTPNAIGRFILRYDPEASLNPITSLSSENIILSSLFYESLFVLDGDLRVQPDLCETWSTEDNKTYVFEIKPDIMMSDGDLMTAEDVAYSLRQAMSTGRYVNRLTNIRSVVSDGEFTVTVTLDTENSRFIYLLDVPIIRDGSIENTIPPGTGPYRFAFGGAMQLNRFSQHRDYADLPAHTIYLRKCADNELTELFDNGELSLIWDDPADTFDIRLNRLHETRFYNTTTLQFIGFNTRLAPMRNADVRRAIGISIERDEIVSDIIPGQSLAAPLALSPAYRLYSEDWMPSAVHPLREMSYLLFSRAGLQDFDEDTFLDYPDGAGGFTPFTLDFIVNSENTHKVQAAQRIASTLRRAGINVAVRELPWANYMNALQLENFDMFFGETVISADFDFSSLLLPEGSLNYGGMGSTFYAPLIDEFLSAHSDHEERIAAKNLVDAVRENAPFVPILYKRYAVYSPMAAISGASHGQSGIFRTISEWSIDFTMLT